MMRDKSVPVRGVLADREMEMGPATPVKSLRHWRLSKGDDGIAWLILDRAGESANSLSEEVMQELDILLADIAGLGVRGLVLRSAKPGGFVAGADIRDFRGVTDAAEVEARMRRAHEIVDRLASLRMPTVAVIHGHCLGGGLEPVSYTHLDVYKRQVLLLRRPSKPAETDHSLAIE